MVDLETLARGPNAHILSIGAVSMDNPDRTFYAVPGTNAQYRTVNNDTIDWWIDQSEAARNEVLIDTGVSLETALKDFVAFFKDCGATRIWSHGVDFDVVILVNAFEQYGIKCPWRFWATEHTRTLISVARRLKGRDFEPDRAGTYHNALHDAQHQAAWMEAIWEGLK